MGQWDKRMNEIQYNQHRRAERQDYGQRRALMRKQLPNLMEPVLVGHCSSWHHEGWMRHRSMPVFIS